MVDGQPALVMISGVLLGAVIGIVSSHPVTGCAVGGAIAIIAIVTDRRRV